MIFVYDLMVLTVPTAATEGKESVKAKVDELLTKQKAKTLACDEWGERPLSYPIAKYDRGMYLVYTVEMEASAANKLKAKLTNEKGVLRHIIVKQTAVK